MKTYLLSFVCLGFFWSSFSWSSRAQEQKVTHHAFNVQATGALTGSAGVSYEFLVSGKNAAFVEGGYAFGNGYTVELSYRRHYARNESHVGLNGPFWGPFIRTGKTGFTYKDPDDDRKYEIDVQSVHVGINAGKRYVWKNRFNLTWRVGYGLPVSTRFDWSPEKSEDSGTIEVLTRILGGLDGELSFGIVL